MAGWLIQEKRAHHSRLFLLVLAATGILIVLSSCSRQPLTGPANLLPIWCHQETSRGMLQGTGVNVLFVTIENRGQDAGPSTMTIMFDTNSPETPHVQLEVKIPAIPTGEERWIAVDLPSAPETASALEPVGKVVITVSSINASRQTRKVNGTLVTSCHDPR